MTDFPAAFDRFRFSFFEDADSARQGLDVVALASLVGDERERAEQELIGFLPDARAIIGLGVLRSTGAAPPLLRLFEGERSARGVSGLPPEAPSSRSKLLPLAKALWQIRPDPRWPAAIIDVLDSAQEPMERQEAAEALYDVRDPATDRALAKALDDPEPLVRYHAGRGLLAVHGLPAESRDPEHMLFQLMANE